MRNFNPGWFTFEWSTQERAFKAAYTLSKGFQSRYRVYADKIWGGWVWKVERLDAETGEQRFPKRH